MSQLIRFGPHTDYQKKQVIDAIESLVIEEKKDYEVTIKPYKLSKSAEQLGYYFTVIVPFKDRCLVFVRHFTDFDGEDREISPTIRDLKTDEMAHYITACVRFLGMNGVKVPLPVRKGE